MTRRVVLKVRTGARLRVLVIARRATVRVLKVRCVARGTLVNVRASKCNVRMIRIRVRVVSLSVVLTSGVNVRPALKFALLGNTLDGNR